MASGRLFFTFIAFSLFCLFPEPTLTNPFKCGKALTGKYGYFTTPGYPRPYHNFLHCTWTITVEPGYRILLHFTDFDVEYYPNCTYDYIKISEPQGKIGTYCGNKDIPYHESIRTKQIIKSTGNRMTVTFFSDYSNEEDYRGIQVHYRIIDVNECGTNNGNCGQFCHNYMGGHYCSCRFKYQLKPDMKSCDYLLCKNVILRSLTGTIQSPEYPNDYPPHTNCTWTIKVPIGYRIILSFEKFKVETHQEVKCPYDYVIVDAGQIHGRLCGRRPPANITSLSNYMIIRFITDQELNMRGFSANYITEGVKCPALKAPLNGAVNSSGTSFKDIVFFSCLPGYNLKGVDRVGCDHTGHWNTKSPECKPVSCGQPGVPDKGSLIGNNFTYKKKVRFQCDDFYEIDGEEEIECESDGVWSDDVPYCIPVCGNSSFANQYRASCRGNIVGGSEAARGSYPWHALLKIGGNLCGGSLLNEFWIITAAHCVVHARTKKVVRPRRVTVLLGLHNRSMENETQVKEFKVGQIFEHRNYNPKTFEADIALLRLSEPVIMSDFVKPVCLPDTDSSKTVIRPKARGVVAGWGKTGKSILPDVLQEVCLPVIYANTCQAAYDKEGYLVTYDMFCAGPASGGQDVCKGDSGGGYIFQDPGDSRWFLGGIVSWGSDAGCALENKYSVYLKVEYYLDWITSIVFR